MLSFTIPIVAGMSSLTVLTPSQNTCEMYCDSGTNKVSLIKAKMKYIYNSEKTAVN